MIIEVDGERVNVRRVPGTERYAVSRAGRMYALNARWRTTWKEIKGYKVKRKTKSGKIVNRDTIYVKIGNKERELHRIIWETFVGPVRNGFSIYHRNGFKEDNSLENLEEISRVRLGKKTGEKASKKTVLKINEKHEVIDVYKSAREAGRENAMSYQTVIDRCGKKNRPKNEFCFGYSFRYESREENDDDDL